MPKTFKCSLNLQRDRSRRADCQKIPRVFLVSAAMFSHLHVNKKTVFLFCWAQLFDHEQPVLFLTFERLMKSFEQVSFGLGVESNKNRSSIYHNINHFGTN